MDAITWSGRERGRKILRLNRRKKKKKTREENREKLIERE